MTKEMIEKRLADLEQQRLNAVAQVYAVLGAIQDCEYWLKTLAEADKPSTEGA